MLHAGGSVWAAGRVCLRVPTIIFNWWIYRTRDYGQYLTRRNVSSAGNASEYALEST